MYHLSVAQRIIIEVFAREDRIPAENFHKLKHSSQTIVPTKPRSSPGIKMSWKDTKALINEAHNQAKFLLSTGKTFANSFCNFKAYFLLTLFMINIVNAFYYWIRRSLHIGGSVSGMLFCPRHCPSHYGSFNLRKTPDDLGVHSLWLTLDWTTKRSMWSPYLWFGSKHRDVCSQFARKSTAFILW